MSEITRLLSDIDQGDGHAAERLLPLVYDELRKLAAARLSREAPGQTLQATALVHEAYLRLVGDEGGPGWDSRGHFFAACAEAMRRILVDRARARATVKRGGAARRVDLDRAAEEVAGPGQRDDDLLALDEALAELERHDETAARLVKLRYYAGLGHQEAAEALGVGRRAADRLWAVARAWLYERLGEP